MSRTATRTARTTIAGLVGSVAASLVLTLGASAPASADNVITPGDFTGYGFDQCLAPTQQAMNVWLKHSPFLSAGIYISGDSRACRNQPNLTPAWIRKQLARGWRLLPITLGPQASCQPRFPRYGDDETINPTPGNKSRYRSARPRVAPRPSGRSPRRRVWASSRPARSGTTSRASTRQPTLPRVGPGVPERVDQQAARARLRLRRLLQRRLRHHGDGQRAGEPPERVHPPRPDLAGPLGRRGEHLARRTSARTGGAPRAGSSSTRAATTRPGAASGSTSTATSSTSAGLDRPPSRTAATQVDFA